jgi:hypothetical protein
VTSFAIVTSLLEWKKHNYADLDLSTVHSADRRSQKGICSPWVPRPLLNAKLLIQWNIKIALVPKYIRSTNDFGPLFNLSGSEVDVPAVEATPYSTSWHIFGAEPVEDVADGGRSLRNMNLKNQRERATVKAMKILLYRMAGMIGSGVALRRFFHDATKSFLKSTVAIIDNLPSGGLYAGGKMLGLRKVHRQLYFTVPSRVLERLDLSGLEQHIEHLTVDRRIHRLALTIGAYFNI